MRKVPLLFAFLIPVFLIGCSDDSSGPSEQGPTSFSRMFGSEGYYTYASDCVVMGDGLRVVTGGFAGTLHVSGLPDTMVATGGADTYLLAFKPDGSLAWKNHLGGGPGFVSTTGIVRDGADNLYTAGAFYGNVTLGGQDFIGNGFNDVLVMRLDNRGHLVWAIPGIGPHADSGNDIAMAHDGGIYVCGLASSEITLAGEDIGEFSGNSGYLVKINPNGVGSWAVTAYGAGPANCQSVTRADDGTVLVCGTYSAGTVDIGGEILPLDGTSASFISRFSPTGEPLGNIRLGGTGAVSAYRITHLGNDVVVAGTFYDSADFDVTVPGGEVTSQGDGDAFIARYSEDGALVWLKTFGDFDDEGAQALSRIGSGELVLVGLFQQYLPVGSKVLTSDGGYDYFIVRLDGNGAIRSSARIGSVGSEDYANATSDGGTMIVVGRTADECTFPDGSRRTPIGFADAFIYQQP